MAHTTLYHEGNQKHTSRQELGADCSGMGQKWQEFGRKPFISSRTWGRVFDLNKLDGICWKCQKIPIYKGLYLFRETRACVLLTWYSCVALTTTQAALSLTSFYVL